MYESPLQPDPSSSPDSSPADPSLSDGSLSDGSLSDPFPSGALSLADDEELERRLGRVDRASELTGPLGTFAAALVFALVVRHDVPTDRLGAWLAVLGVAVGAMVLGLALRRRTALSLPGHALAGMAWGAALLVGADAGGIDDRYLWTCLAFQFATTAGVMAGRTLDEMLGRSVVVGMWGTAAVVLMVLGLPVLAVAAVAFLLLVQRDLAQSSALLHELVDLRAHASRRADRAASAALRDPLTGLLNRAGLEHTLERPRDMGAAMFVDLDHFKDINDRHGHQVGDRVLTVVADRLRSTFRGDDLVARLGGDEFLVVLAGRHDTALLADRATEVIEALERPVDVAGEAILCSASVGVAEIPAGTIDAEQVMRDSDHAMYRAKRGGRRRAVLFGDDLRDEMIERAELSAALRRAVRDGGIEVWGQPVVQLSTGRVAGVELLARWRSDDGTWIPAARFIPIAEEIGVSGEISRAALARAEALFGEWADHDLLGRARLAINVSVVDLGDRGFVQDVTDVVRRSAVPARRLIIEVTESTALAPDEGARRYLESLAELGVTIALDDFGTGYSSIDGLLTLPLTAVKLDRSLTVEAADDVDHARRLDVVGSITELARTLGRNPVAEGVESEEQLRAVARLGIDYVQGYHICPPLPLDELAGAVGRGYLAERAVVVESPPDGIGH